ncbi:MAG: GAF domain-containing protein [Candidatus Dadabacteria bacterium]|nr:GAF domain-containing protein [Candidatus Dadabacteria bacterium]NIQ16200.1 GAF domain-containing protein [Candidatus Dadabacteria bacterium]
MSLSIWFIADFDYLTTYSIFYKFNPSYFAQIFTGAFLFMLAFAFPQPKRFFLKSKLIFMSPVIYCFIIFLTQYIFLNDYSIWKNIDTFIWINNLLATIVVTAVFSYDYFKSDVEVYKQRAIVALTGSLIGFLTPALLGLIFVLFNYDSISFISIPVLFFPLSLAYSIVKHKLFDIDLILQKTIVYGALTGVVASLFIVTVLGFNLVFSTKTGWQNPAFFFILSGLLVVALNPIRDKIQNIIDRAFFRKKYDYRSTVAEVSDAMTSILNVDQIASKVINTITDTMFVDPCTVLILNKETGYFVPYSSNTDKFKHDYLKFDYENKLISFFYGSKKELFREDILADDKFIGSKEELLDEFEKLDASLIIPIAFKDQLLGLLCLGKKKSGQLFNSNDLTLLKTLANQSAIAIENAFALKLVQDYANELEESNKKLKDIQSQLIHAEKMSAIGQLASGIAHEIRNPLNIIEGARFYLSSHIKEVKKDEVVNQYLEYIRNEVQRTNKLIDEILQFSKPSQAEFQKLNINNLIENVLILTRKQISDSYVNIVKDLHNNLPDVYVDSSQIWQVFINMIMNSLEAMDKDGQLNIETGISSNNGIYNNDDEYVYVIFKDDGVGIKDDDMSKIFDPFFTTKASGTGLGLSVSYKIIEAHNGRILVNSEYGKGTNFMVEIPVKDNFLN